MYTTEKGGGQTRPHQNQRWVKSNFKEFSLGTSRRFHRSLSLSKISTPLPPLPQLHLSLLGSLSYTPQYPFVPLSSPVVAPHPDYCETFYVPPCGSHHEDQLVVEKGDIQLTLGRRLAGVMSLPKSTQVERKRELLTRTLGCNSNVFWRDWTTGEDGFWHGGIRDINAPTTTEPQTTGLSSHMLYTLSTNSTRSNKRVVTLVRQEGQQKERVIGSGISRTFEEVIGLGRRLMDSVLARSKESGGSSYSGHPYSSIRYLHPPSHLLPCSTSFRSLFKTDPKMYTLESPRSLPILTQDDN
ncbi:hypothetical protein EV361DRAFT_872390 [Lentinula raphanica]|nr:hypothetical protein EV361DRAFT_872390 [Lentinula raphanica]